MLHKYIRNLVILITVVLVTIMVFLAPGCAPDRPEIPVHDRLYISEEEPLMTLSSSIKYTMKGESPFRIHPSSYKPIRYITT